MQEAAKEHGFEFSKAEMEEVLKTSQGELSDDDLDSVAGGTSNRDAMWQCATTQGINALMNTGRDSTGEDR